jgi:orotidine-5'-phosphate decarboxylase
MAKHFVDRLLVAIERAGSPVCAGIDPVFDRLPGELKGGGEVAAIEAFGLAVIEAVAACVPAVKPQIAYFERYGSAGVAAYERVVAAARKAGLIIIGDVKRNDIGSTAEAYAAGHLARENSPNAITVNGYLGADGLQPFVDAARDAGKGVFVLVRTSNPSAAAIQDFADAAGKKFYEHIAEQVAAIGAGEGLIGQSGYSCVGAVVGATYPDEAARLRQIMPQQIFLVPGYGAQGASAADCAAAFKPDGTGAIVNDIRSAVEKNR